MSAKVILVWFRNDLRTNDNEVLLSAIQKSDFVIPVYIFDPRYYAQNKHGHNNTGEIRAEFIKKSVFALKQKLQDFGGDLLTFEGYPEEIIPHLVQKYDVDEVYHHREVAKRETHISELVEEALWKVKRNLKHFIGHTLYHKEDLPFPIKDIPNDFNTFKKKVIKESFIRPILGEIEKIVIPPHLEKTDLNNSELTTEELDVYGEDAAFKLLENIPELAESNTEAYTLLSPYLALGVLSAGSVYKYLNERITPKNKKGINAIIDNLYLRDYFRFMLKKYPNRYFIANNNKTSSTETTNNWKSANTNNEIINDLMKKLNKTGNLTKHERELSALYFIYELKQNWLDGAAWFENQLIDYAPATTYGFWAHMANEGTSLKNNRTPEDFDKIKEALTPLINTEK